MPVIPCPHLGLDDDATVSRTVPSPSHRCFARQPAAEISSATQTAFCLSGRYTACSYCPKATKAAAPLNNAASLDNAASAMAVLNLSPAKWAVDTAQTPLAQTPLAQSHPVAPEPAWGVALSPDDGTLDEAAHEQDEPGGARRRGQGLLWLLLPLAAIAAFAAVLMVIGNEWLRPLPAALPVGGIADAPLATDEPTATLNPTPTLSQAPALNPDASPVATTVLVAAAVEPSPAQPGRFATPTPVEGGTVVTLNPVPGVAGWWSSGEQRGHLQDSFLYAGRYAGQEFLSAARFDLQSIPRGAALEQVVLRLTGLNADRLAAPATAQTASSAETIWLIQLLGESDAPELERGDYLTALSAPAAITLPPVRADMLAAGAENKFVFDDASRAWLAQQLLDGATSVMVRLLASGGTGETLFAWDSGQGPESAGNEPALVVSYGPPPPTPPPVPTKPFVVATLTPIPANALTVVAQAATATAEAAQFGTATALPYQVYTPTPIPENLATVQAVAAMRGQPAVLLLTPTPANAATATEQAAYATAVALTTGTFTPVPTGFVTPIIVPPSPPAQNVATAAAQVVAATAAALAPSGSGLLPTPTPTPLPFNAVLGVYVYATPVFIPENEATAVAYNRQLNDAILATGTPTPLPWNAIVITVVPTPAQPTPTPIPLFVAAADLTSTPTPTLTSTPPSELPAEVRGKILFKSDRGGSEALYMLDPVAGDVTLITQSWVFDLAQGRLPFSPDGANRALVKQDDNGKLQIHIESLQYGTVSKLTALGGDNYDPAWSPAGAWIAFVSTETGGDEIYRVDPTGAVAQRLTANTWEWDKHPTWSPDGSQIVFFSNRESGRRQLWIMDADGANQRNLSSNEYNDWDPIWVW